jgi:hypothetical protein
MKNVMLEKSLNDSTTLELLVELIHEGSSGIIPGLKAYEPIEQAKIFQYLAIKNNINFGESKQAWLDWFLSKECPHSSEDKRILHSLLEFKSQTDPLFDKLRAS